MTEKMKVAMVGKSFKDLVESFKRIMNKYGKKTKAVDFFKMNDLSELESVKVHMVAKNKTDNKY